MTGTKDLHTLLPWYVNGTLETATRRALDRELAQSPTLRSEAVWLRLLRSQIREQMQTEINARPHDVGLDALMALVHGEQSGKVSPMPTRVGSWIEGVRRMPLSLGLAAAIVLTQAVVIAALLDSSARDTLKALSGITASGGQIVQVPFKPLATETQIRTLLSSVQGEIVGGPGALGVYSVRVAQSQGQISLEKLRTDTTAVDTAVLLPNR